MPSSGSGTGTAITVGVGAPGTGKFYPAIPYTLLPLSRYAEIMGINPIQFMSGTAPDAFPETGPSSSGQLDRWLTYPWQDHQKVTRYDLARAIQRAEQDIRAQLGYFPAPTWTTDENVPFPRFHRREYVPISGLTIGNREKAISLRYGKFIAGGVRAVSLVAQATTSGGALVYTDEDSDGVIDTATITLATTLTDASEIRVFTSGFSGQKEYEIRPLNSVTISGGNVVITLDAWLLFNWEKLAAFPGDGYDWLAITDGTNLEAEVDVYRVYNDPSTSAVLKWTRHPRLYTGDTYMALTTQTAGLLESNPEDGLVIPFPGTYDSDEDSWTSVAYTGKREPERVDANYYSGARDQKGAGDAWVMPDDLAWAVVNLATARLPRPLCTFTENVKAREEDMREDLIYVSKGDNNDTRFVTKEVMNNPFGTRRGEVEAWRIVSDRIKEGNVKVPMPALL